MMELEKREIAGVQVCRIPGLSFDEFHITATPIEGEAPEMIFEKAAQAACECGGTIVSQDVFGVLGSAKDALTAAFGQPTWPITWVVDGALSHLCGTQLVVVGGLEVTPIEINGRIVGNVYEDDNARFCRLSGMGPEQPVGTRLEQTRETFLRIQAALEQGGFDFLDVVRTWFYNDDILDWYDDFNVARDDWFKERGVYDHYVPASTGIGGTNIDGAALVVGILAVKARNDRTHYEAIPSPLQCPALDYGSSFSRASELVMPGSRRVIVSGSASIEPGGKTVHLDDMYMQIDLTMRVVGAILESRGMSWNDVVRSIAYIRNAKDAEVYTRYCRDKGLPCMPEIVTNNVVCRDDLLFEIEVDAALEA